MGLFAGNVFNIILLSGLFYIILKFKYVFYQRRWIKAIGITLLTLLYKVDVSGGFVQRGYPIKYLLMDEGEQGYFLNIASFDIASFIFDVFICAVALYMVNRYVNKNGKEK